MVEEILEGNLFTRNSTSLQPIHILPEKIRFINPIYNDPQFWNFWNYPFAPSPPSRHSLGGRRKVFSASPESAGPIAFFSGDLEIKFLHFFQEGRQVRADPFKNSVALFFA